MAVGARSIDLNLVKINKIERFFFLFLNQKFQAKCLRIKKKSKREHIEQDLEFLGLIIMENKLKAETFQAISNLKNANIRTIMCTGDNMLTALSVSRECQIIDSHNENICLVEVGDDKKLNFTNIPKSDDLHFKVRNLLLINCQILIYNMQYLNLFQVK